MDQPLDEPATGRPPAPRYWPSAIAAIGVSTALVGTHALIYGRWLVDDAAITFAYVRSITNGDGPVLQPGADQVEGYSNPAWLAVLAVGRILGVFDRGTILGVPDYVVFPKAIALLCCAAMFTAFYVAARALSRRPALVTITAGTITAAIPSFVIWSFSGLENALLALSAAWIAAVLVRAVAADRLLETSTAVTCGLLAALAALTRPDGLIYITALPAAALILLHRAEIGHTIRSLSISIIAFVIPAGTYLTWRLLTFGHFLPNTAVAKSQGIPSPDNVTRIAELGYYVGPIAVALTLLLVGATLAQPWPGRRAMAVLLIPLVLAISAYGVLEPDWMGQYRFATPAWALGALAAAVGFWQAVPLLAARGRVLVAGTAALGLLSAGVTLAESAREFRASPTVPMCSIAQHMGWSFNGYAAILGLRDASLVTPDIGGTALVSDLRIIDLAGLADARIAERWSTGDMESLRDDIFAARPEFIETHHGWSPLTGLVDDPRLTLEYAEIRRTAPTDGVWVRRDLVADGEQLAALRDYDSQVAIPAEEQVQLAPRSSCGDVLAPREI